jgi:hypothetical protein
VDPTIGAPKEVGDRIGATLTQPCCWLKYVAELVVQAHDPTGERWVVGVSFYCTDMTLNRGQRVQHAT